jgi:hypothetical protein
MFVTAALASVMLCDVFRLYLVLIKHTKHSLIVRPHWISIGYVSNAVVE